VLVRSGMRYRMCREQNLEVLTALSANTGCRSAPSDHPILDASIALYQGPVEKKP
jgi:hypothetical protein